MAVLLRVSAAVELTGRVLVAVVVTRLVGSNPAGRALAVAVLVIFPALRSVVVMV
nr:hypothetical protein [Dermatophilus congolensis]